MPTKRQIFHCPAQGVPVQLEWDQVGECAVNGTCSVQHGCCRYMKPAYLPQTVGELPIQACLLVPAQNVARPASASNRSVEKLREAVNAITKGEDILAIVQSFNLHAEDRSGNLDQILGIYLGQINGQTVRITHRWYDRCRPFSIQPDGNKVKLEIDGVQVAEGSFLDDH